MPLDLLNAAGSRAHVVMILCWLILDCVCTCGCCGRADCTAGPCLRGGTQTVPNRDLESEVAHLREEVAHLRDGLLRKNNEVCSSSCPVQAYAHRRAYAHQFIGVFPYTR